MAFVIYLIFHPRSSPNIPSPPQRKRHSLSKATIALSPERRRALASKPYPLLPKLIALAVVLLVVLVFAPTLIIVFSPSVAATAPKSLVQDWSFFTSTLSLAAATLQYLPQLHSTWKLKHHKSLSLATLIIQIPVFLVLGISKRTQPANIPQHPDDYRLISRLQNTDGITYLDYIVSASVEAFLLTLCLYLHYVRPRFLNSDLDGDEEIEEEYITGLSICEETPLLGKRDEGGGRDLQTSERLGREMCLLRR
ncbi:MAG: hypothetical protein Q9181_000635 [Wetmoreana brouardii]